MFGRENEGNIAVLAKKIQRKFKENSKKIQRSTRTQPKTREMDPQRKKCQIQVQ
jgi:hypothetical protein